MDGTRSQPKAATINSNTPANQGALPSLTLKRIYQKGQLKTYSSKPACNRLALQERHIMFLYIAIHKDENTGYGVTVPALSGCFSYGDTLDKAIEETKQAILFHIEGMLEDGEEPEIHQPTLETLMTNPDYAGAQWIGIEVNISHLTLKPERFNVSWPKYLLDKVDSYVTLTHDSRSNFLAKAALDRMNSTSTKASAN